MAPILYYFEVSPYVRNNLLLIKALGIEVELSPINLALGEHMTPEYLKMNPFHTVPTLKDGDFVVWDSHAINIYLIDKYAPGNDLYPSDPQKKATINQRLFFNTGIVSPRLGAIAMSLLEGATSISKDKADSLAQAYIFLEALLERSTYAAGENVTIADFALIGTITSANVLVPIAENRFPKIVGWISRMQKLPYYKEANQSGLDQFAMMVKSRLA